MTSVQKLLLIASTIYYLATLFGFLTAQPGILLVCFIIHSLFLLVFAYTCFTSNAKESEPQQDLEAERAGARERYNIMLAAKQEATEELQRALMQAENLKDEKSQLENRLAELTLANTQLTEKLDELMEEMEDTALQPEKATGDYSSFLPPLGENSTGLETLNIIQVARDTANEFIPFAKKAGVNIQVSAATDKLMVRADLNRIRIMFRNIIDNSIKYMNRAGTMVITLSTIGDDIFIVLKDNGNGLSPAETSHIFEINYQGSNRISGNGLGLTQAKAIVDSYGGTIYAKSTEGKGMGIYIQIPVQ